MNIMDNIIRGKALIWLFEKNFKRNAIQNCNNIKIAEELR